MAVAKPNELIHLDANFAVAALGRRSSESQLLQEWLRRKSRVAMSAVAWSEYRCGPRGERLDEARVRAARQLLGEIEPFTEADAELASELFNQTGRRSRSHVDCMIAAHAIGRGAVLATLNTVDFQRFENLRLAPAL